MSAVLQVRDLVTRFHTGKGTVHAVNGISYSVDAGEALAIVGESGCGKTVSALSLMGLVPGPHGSIEGGEVVLDGRDLLQLTEREWQRVRGREIALVFQDPTSALNPVLSVGTQLTEGLLHHVGGSRAAARRKALDWLERVGIADAERRLDDYPHEFSGGQRQRIVIAMALLCEPAVLIADEPTTSLDVTIQAQIVALIRQLQAKLGMAIVWITHDLALVAGFADRVAVMYAGHIVEMASAAKIYEEPKHPYTLGLLRSMPGPEVQEERRRLETIEGRPPDLRQYSEACPFAPRCAWVVDRCRAEKPDLVAAGPGHLTACFRWDELSGGSPEGVT